MSIPAQPERTDVVAVPVPGLDQATMLLSGFSLEDATPESLMEQMTPLLDYYDTHEARLRSGERRRLANAILAESDLYQPGGFRDGIRHAAMLLLDPKFAVFDPESAT